MSVLLSPSRRGVVRVPDLVWAPVASGLLILIVGLLGLAARQPWLFPSLGPTAYMLTQAPGQQSSRFYNVLVGHLVGIAAALFAVSVVGAVNAPPVLPTHHLTAVRVWAAVIAITLDRLFAMMLKATHPPSAATTLLIALGLLRTTRHDVLVVVAGVLIVAVFGEVIRWFRFGALPQPS